MKEYLLAVDIGTTSAKCLAVSSSGEVIASEQHFYPTSFSEHGYAEQDPEAICKGVLEIIKTSIDQSNRCLGICFSAAMHSLTAVDEKGSLIMPLMIWSDLRSKNQFHEIEKQGLISTLCQITGTPVHPMSPLCKLLWLKEERKDVFSSAHKFISIKELILFRLTGKFIVDHSIASATGLFDLEKLTWSEQALKLIGLSPDKLSQPVHVFEKIALSISSAKELSLDKNVPIIAGASDGCLAQLGSGAMEHGDLSITIGTSGAVRMASSKRVIDPEGKIFNYILRDKEYVCGGATNSGTAVLNWFSRNFGNSSSDLVKFVEQASSTSPGSEGLMMLPYLFGERAPLYHPDARGVFFGMAPHHLTSHFQRAILEGICMEIAWIKELIEQSFGDSKRIFVSGGFTHSPTWVQLLSDVLGCELLLLEDRDASSMGAALLGFEALGISLKREKEKIQTFHPDMKIHALYSKLFPLFKKLYSQTIGLLEDLNKITE